MSVEHKWTAAGLAERISQLRYRLAQLERCHERGGTVSWSTFAADQPAHAGKVVELKAADFQSGTLRVRESCTLRLTESVEVNPNRPSAFERAEDGASESPSGRRLGWFPNLSDPQQRAEYGAEDVAHAYHLGFFASIAIETEGVILDLGGHTLKMHPEFALQQRFHSLIELADRPFITGEGPADFGRMLRSARRVWIRNGTLGRSAHHGIHGNDAEDVLITDLVLRDYEVAGIALNGGRGIAIEDCRLEGNRADTPVLGTYSAGRFVARLAQTVVDRFPALSDLRGEVEQLRERVEHLEQALDTTFARVIHGAESAPDPLFHNNSGLTDGNAYGIVIHGRGAAVGSLLHADADQQIERASDVWIRGVTLSQTRAEIREIVAIAEPDRIPVQDPIGSILPLWPHGKQPGNMDDRGLARPTVLGAVQLQLSKLLHILPSSVAARLVPARIPWSVIAWAQTERRLVPRSDDPRRLVIVDDAAPSEVLAEFEVRCNGDTMHHVNKGVIGVFIQAVDGLVLEQIDVNGVSNTGGPGSLLAGPYTGPTDGGHAGQGHQLGYGGADTRGVYLGACCDARVRNVRIEGIESTHGSAYGLELAAASRRLTVQDCRLGTVAAGTRRAASPGAAGYPNGPSRAVGIVADQTTASISLRSCTFDQSPTQPGPAPGRVLELSCGTALVDLRSTASQEGESSMSGRLGEREPVPVGYAHR